MSSITLTVTGDKSSLDAYFHPEIELDERYNYSCCLLDFYTYNSIPNVDKNNNKFYFQNVDSKGNLEKEFYIITIPDGATNWMYWLIICTQSLKD